MINQPFVCANDFTAAAKAFSKRSPYSHAVIRNLLKSVSALGG